ncbi:MAG: hypothetical protein V8Q39_04625 [Anaerovoracaceae bacterium]
MAKVITAAEAAALINDNDVIGAATFGAAGVPESIMKAIEKRFWKLVIQRILHIFTRRVPVISLLT